MPPRLHRPAVQLNSVLFLAALAFCGASYAAEIPNLVQDPSFEAPTRSWLGQAVPFDCFAEKEQLEGAREGKKVLAVQGWQREGSKLLSPPIGITGAVFSAGVDVRARGATEVKLELALFDEAGTKKLASFFTKAPGANGQWTRLNAEGVSVPGRVARARLGLIISGSQKGARLEFDRLALFAGPAEGNVSDTSEFTSFEAEEMADGKAWKVVDHYTGWYADAPSGLKMLAGFGGVAEADNKPAVKAVAVKSPGPHRLWVRLMRTSAATRNTYTLSVNQNGKTVATRVIDDGDEKLGPDFSWVWAPVDVTLEAGPAEVQISRPASEASWVARKVDLFVLTNLPDYVPQIQDFRPRGFVRFTNESAGQEPLCLWMFVHRLQPPIYYVTPGMLSAAGLSGSYYAPDDHTKWFAAGEASPWVNLSDSLVPSGNLIQILATRGSHTQGFVSGRVQGKLEFAVGDERRVVKTVQIDQKAPRLQMTLPADFSQHPDEILTGTDYVAKSEAAVEKAGAFSGKMARHLDLSALVALDNSMDDPGLVEREIGVLKRLGFNGTNRPVTDAARASEFYEKHGLAQHFTSHCYVWHFMKSNARGEPCHYLPDIKQIDETFKAESDRMRPIIDKIEGINLADEPGGPSYAHITSCEVCRPKFVEALKAEKRTPEELGVKSWDEVRPVAPTGRTAHPELFYQTGLFRLRSFADFAKAVIAEKRKYFPPNVKGYLNYSPPALWDERGTDLFFAQRGDALELGFSEDWLGYGAGPQGASNVWALLRAAGGPNQPLGAYSVGVSGGPLLQRIKYYTLLAEGVKHINAYSYGPAYASVDSWSTTYDLYRVIGQVLHEFGAVDEAIHGTTRRKTDIAILYNRTSGIWANPSDATELDAGYTRWALQHAGNDADFLCEDDIVAGKLAGYKTFYLNGVQIRRDAAGVIAKWTGDGGVLFGAAGAGSRDEHDRPLDILAEVFGAESVGLKLEQDAGRPMYELRGLPPLGTLTTGAGFDAAAPLTFDQLCYRETLKPHEGTTVFAKSAAGEALGTLHPFNKGKAIRVAALPGIAYLHEAVKGKDYKPETYLPQKYRPELRHLLTWPARLAGAARVASSNLPISQIARFDGPGRSVLVIIDHSGATGSRKVVLNVPDADRYTKARSARGRTVELKKVKEGLELQVEFELTDAIVLEE